ncbi:hypothetical protein J6TS1_22340 [Siminovitchia terrae]|uniref:DUF2759 family protein n=1 Tax=Siminovitchia terrae TaxID=1914933 RepID=A0A429XDD5_SIMTE|nr:DUF2759 family protein [Siminovitchia terrae]RST61440.1 DUF2759 family protein [Siminovitchia terrae]GIN89611.1 hypothetical protein J22TS1_06620 [Siminovitchia terrae]GIN96364.1 hypothetical protein J6TS1_22340 [Siminovitchia terrae]
MGTAIIFGLVAILAIFALIGTLKNRSVLGFIFSFGTVAVFGFFAVMTLIKSGFPE